MYDKYERLLKENNTNTSKVAKATGIDKSFFSKWKAGKFTPKYDKMQKIADHFGVPISYFYGEELDKNWEEHKESIDNLDVADLLDMMCDAILKRVESDFDKESYKSNMKRYSDFLISEMKNGNEHKD